MLLLLSCHSPLSRLSGSLQGKSSDWSPAAQLTSEELLRHSLSPEMEMGSCVSPPLYQALQKWCHFHSHCHRGAPCTFLGVFTVVGSHPWVGSDLSTPPQEYINVTSARWSPAPVEHLKRMREALPLGHRTPCEMDGGRKFSLSRDVSWVCALISAFSALYLSVKQELEVLYCFKARNGCNEMRSPPETHLGTNFILCSYLRINFHCFLRVVE